MLIPYRAAQLSRHIRLLSQKLHTLSGVSKRPGSQKASEQVAVADTVDPTSVVSAGQLEVLKAKPAHASQRMLNSPHAKGQSGCPEALLPFLPSKGFFSSTAIVGGRPTGLYACFLRARMASAQ